MIAFIRFLFQEFPMRLIPIASGFLVFTMAIWFSIMKNEYRPLIRIFSSLGFFLLFLSISAEMVNPVIQIYLEDELNIIFLEADKVTGIIRNLRYLIYPLGFFLVGFAMFDDRFEESVE